MRPNAARLWRPASPILRCWCSACRTTRWPYGLGDSGFAVEDVAPRFQLPVTVLLGDQDIDTTQDNPAPGQGVYYLVKYPSPCGSWQTHFDEEPGRDASLP